MIGQEKETNVFDSKELKEGERKREGLKEMKLSESRISGF
jgi:hypothetical protein